MFEEPVKTKVTQNTFRPKQDVAYVSINSVKMLSEIEAIYGTIETFFKETHISKKIVNSIIYYPNWLVTTDMARRLAAALNVNVGWLVSGVYNYERNMIVDALPIISKTRKEIVV